MNVTMSVQQRGPRARRRARVLLASAAVLACALAVPAGANTGPVSVSIPSVGGYQMCINNINPGDTIHHVYSYQGTRHPYRAALYGSADGLIGLSGQISNDLNYYWNETTQLGGQNAARLRVDNQAASSGNGGYTCYSLAV